MLQLRLDGRELLSLMAVGCCWWWWVGNEEGFWAGLVVVMFAVVLIDAGLAHLLAGLQRNQERQRACFVRAVDVDLKVSRGGVAGADELARCWRRRWPLAQAVFGSSAASWALTE